MKNITVESRVREVLREFYGGDFETTLEIEYENKITNELLDESFENKHKWATYNQVVLELKKVMYEDYLSKKLQYLLTDNVLPKNSCLEVIQDVYPITPELQRLKDKIYNFDD